MRIVASSSGSEAGRRALHDSITRRNNVLKRITITAALFAALILRSIAASPEAEARFIADAKAAFDAKDSAKLLSLVCWDRVTPAMKQMVSKQLSALVQKPVVQFQLVAQDPKQKVEYTRDGVTYRPNLAGVKELKITFKSDATGLTSAGLPVGEKDGKLFITTAASAK